MLTLFLTGEGGISTLIVYHVTKSVRNRVKMIFANGQAADQGTIKEGKTNNNINF